MAATALSTFVVSRVPAAAPVYGRSHAEVFRELHYICQKYMPRLVDITAAHEFLTGQKYALRGIRITFPQRNWPTLTLALHSGDRIAPHCLWFQEPDPETCRELLRRYNALSLEYLFHMWCSVLGGELHALGLHYESVYADELP
jgi:hypothetical protein